METTKSLDEILEIRKEFEGNVLNKIISALDGINNYTEDSKAVIAAAKTIGKYSEKTAENIANKLLYIARKIKDPKIVISAAETTGKYNEEVVGNIIRLISVFSKFANITNNPKIIIEPIKILSLEDIVNTIEKYKGRVAGYIASRFINFASEGEDERSITKIAKIMSLEDVVNTIGRYKRYTANAIAYGLINSACQTKDEDSTTQVAKILSLNYVASTIKMYNGELADYVAYNLSSIASITRKKEVTISMCNSINNLINKVGKRPFDIQSPEELLELHNKGLDKLVERKEDFAYIAAYLKSNEELPLPNKDNIKDYNRIVADYLLKLYGIQKRISSNQLFMLYSADKDDRDILTKLIKNAYEKYLKIYSIKLGAGKELEINSEKLRYHFLISIIGSRDHSKEKEAITIISEIVGDKAVNKARNAFNTYYKDLRKDIIQYVNRNDINKALKLLKNTGDEAINNVISASEYRDGEELKGQNILEAVESNNPLDYDSGVQIACVYLPNPHRRGIYNYCNDERFKLIRYGVNGNSIGSAICYLEDGNFLVDSVEGHRTFRKEKIFDVVYKDLVNRAKEYNAKRIIFNMRVLNDTPKKFIENIKKYQLNLDKIKMPLNTDGYLEASKEGVQGYVVDFSDTTK